MAEKATGTLETLKQGGGFLRDPARSYQPDRADVFVPQKLIQRHGLASGARITGPTEPGKKGVRLVSVDTVCGMSPDDFRNRTPFAKLLAINPETAFQPRQDRQHVHAAHRHARARRTWHPPG